MAMTKSDIHDTLACTTARLTFLSQALSGTDETSLHLTDEGLFGLTLFLRDMAEDVKAASEAL
jgi:hypothetical protein